jgi:hypothetical protein
MKNKLPDLNNHLFAQLERLSEEGLTPEQLDLEIRRTDAIARMSMQIIETAEVGIRAAKLIAEYGGDYQRALPNVGETFGAPEPTKPLLKAAK